MKIYYVIKKGVYIQGIYGIFDDYDLAKKACEEAIKSEQDDYHAFFVCERQYIWALRNKSNY